MTTTDDFDPLARARHRLDQAKAKVAQLEARARANAARREAARAFALGRAVLGLVQRDPALRAQLATALPAALGNRERALLADLLRGSGATTSGCRNGRPR
jgi:hypothetical protein